MKTEHIKFYKKNGWIIIRDVFRKNYIQKIKKELLKQTKNKGKFFYYETIKKKPRLRRIERVTDFSKNAKKIICSKRTLGLIQQLEEHKYTLFKDKLNFKFPGGKGYLPHIDGHFYWKDKKKNIKTAGKNILLIL